MAAFPFKIIALLFIYLFGVFANALTFLAVILKTKWTKNPGLLLIVSLSFSDFADCFLSSLGMIESILAVYFPAEISASSSAFLVGLNYLIGFWANLAWGTCTFHILTMAANRFVAVVFPARFAYVFSARNTKIFIVLCWLLSIFYTSAHYFVCCPIVWTVEIATSVYTLPPNITYFFNTPDYVLSTFAVITPAILYAFIAVRLMQLKQRISVDQQQSTFATVDAWLCLQFAIVLVIYETMCVTFFLVEYWIFQVIVAYIAALNYAANPAVYWLFNRTIQDAVKEMLNWKTPTRMVRQQSLTAALRT